MVKSVLWTESGARLQLVLGSGGKNVGGGETHSELSIGRNIRMLIPFPLKRNSYH